MEKQRRIALLNMRYDNNYGGNLQRYAMVTVLQRMGYSVEYLYIRDNWDDWFEGRGISKIIKQTAKQFVRHIRHPRIEPWLAWHRESTKYSEECKSTEPFLEKYIPHTKVIYSHRELKHIFKYGGYNAIVVGSDQIWRKRFVERYGLGTWFVDFVSDDLEVARVVYGASFGVDGVEYSKNDLDLIRPLFEHLAAVSVREMSGIDLLTKYGLNNPQAEVVLDPTLLLEMDDYNALIENADTKEAEGDMFCYVLNRTEEMDNQISNMAEKKGMTSHVVSLSESCQMSIEQWLRNIRDAKFIYTDSYHGLIFAIIFRKPFYLSYNDFRGNARFDSLLRVLNLSCDGEKVDWDEVSETVNEWRSKSTSFLKNALSIEKV